MNPKIQALHQSVNELKIKVASAIAKEKRLAKLLQFGPAENAPEQKSSLQEVYLRQQQTTEQLKESLRRLSDKLSNELAKLKPN